MPVYQSAFMFSAMVFAGIANAQPSGDSGSSGPSLPTYSMPTPGLPGTTLSTSTPPIGNPGNTITISPSITSPIAVPPSPSNPSGGQLYGGGVVTIPIGNGTGAK